MNKKKRFPHYPQTSFVLFLKLWIKPFFFTDNPHFLNTFSTRNTQVYILIFCFFFSLVAQQNLHSDVFYFTKRELQAHELIEYALVFSGAEQSENFMKIYTHLTKNISFIDHKELKSLQALQLLDFLHNHFLVAYDYYQTRMDTLLETRSYNCVSLSLLYAALLRELGFKAYLLGSFDHTRVAIKLSEQNWLLVETTDKSVQTWEQTSKLEEELLTDNQALALILRNLLFIAQEEKQDLQIFLKLQTDLAELTDFRDDYNNLFELQVAYSLEKYAAGGIFETIDFLDQMIEVYQADRLKKVRSKFIYNEIVTKFNNNQFAESEGLYYLLSLKMLPEHLRKIMSVLKLKK